MSTDEVQILKRAVEDLSERMDKVQGTLGTIHAAVMSMAGKTYVPGPKRSWWSRVGSMLGGLI